MKRFVILMIIVILITGLISAQGIKEPSGADPQMKNEQRPNFHPERRDQRPNVCPEGRKDRRHNVNPEGRRDRRHNVNPDGRRDQRPNVNPQNREGNRQREQNTVTINGVLKLERGFVAIQNDAPNAPNTGSAFYMVPMLNRYIGFINGLREDARVTIEGIQFRNIIHPTKLIIGDRTYNFPAFNPQNQGFGAFQNRQHSGNFKKNMERLKPDNKRYRN